MAYDEALAARVRGALAGRPDVTEKRMFGGVGFLAHGNMACGVHGKDLIVRVGPAVYEDALAEPGARVFDLTGRVMSGWVMVGEKGHRAGADLASWVERGLRFALTLPPK